MDPDALLAQLRDAVADLAQCEGPYHAADLAFDLADAFTNLDNWLTTGGFLPAAWRGDHK